MKPVRRATRASAIDQIIVGIKRLSKVGKLVFGSNAAYVVLHAHCPVVTTR
jgi:nucleotide-binding universal stress UspA family protein